MYDTSGSDVVSPLLTVGELRDLGVTLHLPLAAVREPLAAVAAVYLCLPSEDNVVRICRDLAADLYGGGVVEAGLSQMSGERRAHTFADGWVQRSTSLTS